MFSLALLAGLGACTCSGANGEKTAKSGVAEPGPGAQLVAGSGSGSGTAGASSTAKSPTDFDIVVIVAADKMSGKHCGTGAVPDVANATERLLGAVFGPLAGKDVRVILRAPEKLLEPTHVQGLAAFKQKIIYDDSAAPDTLALAQSMTVPDEVHGPFLRPGARRIIVLIAAQDKGAGDASSLFGGMTHENGGVKPLVVSAAPLGEGTGGRFQQLADYSGGVAFEFCAASWDEARVRQAVASYAK